MNKPIRLYLVTGFLGAGKTTFIKSVLEKMQGERVGVIVNEFGSVGIDGKVLQSGDIKLVEINNGSIFCSCLKSGFIKTLIAFLEQPVDVLFIEASGLADPSGMNALLGQIMAFARNNKKIERAYDYRGSVCIIDCTTFLKYCDVLTPAKNHVIKSNFILINKTDLVSDEVKNSIHKKIHRLNPEAKLIDTCYSQVSMDAVRDYLTTGNDVAETSNQPWNRPATYVLDLSGIYDKGKMMAFCQGLAEKVLRVKGFFKDRPGDIHIDMVGNSIHFTDVQQTGGLSPDETVLVIIGKDGLDIENDIRKIWESLFTEKIMFIDY